MVFQDADRRSVGVIDPVSALELKSTKDSNTDGYPVRNRVVRGSLDGVAESVSEIEEQTFRFVELVHLDEMFFSHETVDDDSFEGLSAHAGARRIGNMA